MKKWGFILFLFITLSSGLLATPYIRGDYAKGPLVGKNFFIPQLIHYNLNGVNAAVGKQFQFNYHIALYYSQAFNTNGTKLKLEDKLADGTYNHTKYVAIDFEGTGVELGADIFLTRQLQLGLNMRLISFYGGFIDNIIEGFHHIFTFPNGGRELFAQNNIFINIETANNLRIMLDSPTVGFGDIDIWVKYNFFHHKKVDLAAFGALKIPSGQRRLATGSGGPDFAFALLADFHPIWLLHIYLQNALVIPVGTDGYLPFPMYNALIGFEISPHRVFSIIGQFNIKTSPVEGTYLYPNNVGIKANFFSSPQTNLLIGFIWKIKQFQIQFYFEEDTFTNAGTDFTINLRFTHSIKLRR